MLHSEGVHTTKHDQIEQHISKKIKIHVKTHKIIIFRPFSQGFLQILLCNQILVATGCNQLLTIGPNWLQVWFSPVFFTSP